MRYNIYIRNDTGSFNFLAIDDTILEKLITAYNNGDESIFFQGKKNFLGDIIEIQIFEFDNEGFKDGEDFFNYHKKNRNIYKSLLGDYISSRMLEVYGRKVTDNYIKGEFGYLKNNKSSIKNDNLVELSLKKSEFISATRIKELSTIKNSSFDLTRLIKLCQELNDNYSCNNFMTCAMICRTILNHVPPIFGYKNFENVANNYGGPKEHKSFKKNMSHLNNSLKNIADRHLHSVISGSESLPNENQVDFKQDLDVLLEEICRNLK